MFCIVNKSEDAFTSCSRDRREGNDNWFVLSHKTFDPGIIYIIIRTEDPNLGINHSKTFTSNPNIYMKEIYAPSFSKKMKNFLNWS